MFHGMVISKNDIGDVKKGDFGMVTAYLTEAGTFAVIFGPGKWYTFNNNEEWFLNNFEYYKTEEEFLISRRNKKLERILKNKE